MLRAFAAALVVTLAAGCASIPRAERDARAFDLLGRVLVAWSGGGFSANLRWQHAEQDEIALMTPTGQTVAQIIDTGNGAKLTQADQKSYTAGSVESLTRQALGWPLPLSLLQYWVRGQAAPGFPVTGAELDGNGRLTALTQNGWRVAIAYNANGEAAGRVRRLDLHGSGNEIRFVIDTWRNADTGAESKKP
jgi:outer membrane lipoprotein LolB